MADFILSNGDEVTFDLDKLTFGEWQELRSPAFARKKELEILSKVSGLEIDKINSLTMTETKNFYSSLVNKIIAPIEKN